MAKKISIDGNLIGTQAEQVEYTKSGWQNATNAKTALDDLQTRLTQAESDIDTLEESSTGGDEINNGALAALADTLIESSGIHATAFTRQYYVASNNNNLAVGSSFDPTNLGDNIDYGDSYTCHYALDIYEGEVLHYENIGWTPNQFTYVHGYVICDQNNKVVALGEKQHVGSGTVTAPANSRYAYITGKQGNLPRAWVTYTNRPHLKTKVGVYQAFGDSISTDNQISNFPAAYPRLLADKFGAVLHRDSQGGAHITHLGACIGRSRFDADIITICYGCNDALTIKDNPSALGSAQTALELLPADGSLDDISSEDLNTLKSTRIGYYRWCLAVLLEKFLIKPNVRIFCIGPFDISSEQADRRTALASFRTQLSALVSGLDDARVKYINGLTVLPYVNYWFFDAIHPNETGQVVVANNLYAYIGDMLGVL